MNHNFNMEKQHLLALLLPLLLTALAVIKGIALCVTNFQISVTVQIFFPQKVSTAKTVHYLIAFCIPNLELLVLYI